MVSTPVLDRYHKKLFLLRRSTLSSSFPFPPIFFLTGPEGLCVCACVRTVLQEVIASSVYVSTSGLERVQFMFTEGVPKNKIKAKAREFK